ncbi:MAG TPA: hypothetical protein VFH00_03270 [Candidatus Nitrosotalea sp.]|nr:hypothetical protein [Candidatus Nitrosotalea sp.]
MNKRPGHVTVTTEVAMCSFCGRPRNLRREEHQLGTFVRTVVTCETCHRTLSSTMGVASADAPAAETAPAKTEVAASSTARPRAAPKVPAAKPTVATKANPAAAKSKATKARTTKTK